MADRKHVSGVGSYGFIPMRSAMHYRPQPMLSIINKAMNEPALVPLVCDEEIQAKLAGEYGFDANCINPEADCWYEATDWNHFRFSVNGWHYEAEDYGELKVLPMWHYDEPEPHEDDPILHNYRLRLPTIKPASERLTRHEAKAIICERYGFSHASITPGYGAIYKSPSESLIRFLTLRWAYEAENLGALKVIDHEDVPQPPEGSDW